MEETAEPAAANFVRLVSTEQQHRNQKQTGPVHFNRQELDIILNIYGRMVAAGEWRDYAIGAARDHATFAIFRRTNEVPLFRIEKNPKLANRQGAYAIINQSGMVLKRGRDLRQVLRVLDKSLRLIGA